MSGRKPKASKATVLLRLTEIWRIRLDGASIIDAAEYVAEQEQLDGSPWKLPEGETPLSRRQIERYVQRADEAIAASTRERRRQALVKRLARREHLYAKAVNAGDVRTALAVEIDIARLRDLYPPQRKQLTGKDGAPLIPPDPLRISEVIVTTRQEADAAIAALSAATGISRQ
jgi:hypothetical protein